jgi:peptidoglycan/LPS O-acetylase OafA/YrhL
MSYRPDIDGLRAVAVIAVILFHAGVPLVTGGFEGVDVFFVISGYLITGGILRDLERGSFRILAFYERRVRRIYPALLILLVMALAAGSVIFMPDELKDLGAEAATAVAFSSNILFWHQTDYFAGAAELKPLLHTWSLAVEEQFYLIIAPLMGWAYSLGRRRAALVLLAILCGSFFASCLATRLDPAGNYYLPQYRAWELLIGSMLALGAVPQVRGRLAAELGAWVGMALLLIPMALLDRDSPFPAWNAVPTCIGTALIIRIGERHGTSAGRLLGLEPLRWIGLISYSLYLVHWPILAFARYQMLREPTPAEMAGLMLCMLALAYLSWRFVEIPFRRRKVPRRRLFGEAAIASAVVVIAGAGVFALQGLPQRLGGSDRIPSTDVAQETETAGCFLDGNWRAWRGRSCFLTHGSGPVIMLWGDSHANHYAPVLMAEDRIFPSKVLLYASTGCPPILDLEVRGRPDCKTNNDHALAVIKQFRVTKVVLSASWQYDFEHSDNALAKLGETVQLLRRLGVRVSVIGDNPIFPFANAQYLAARLMRRSNPNAPYYSPVVNDFRLNREIARAVAPTPLFDPLTLLCEKQSCLAFQDGQLMMHDNGHLSTYGARYLLARMGGMFR